MKKITIILLGFIALLAVSCDKDDHLAPDKSKYVYDIPQTDLPVDAIVGAYYTNITSSSSWLKSGKKIYAGTPLLGEYLSTTSGVLQQQLAWADEAALDFLIVTWDAASADNTLITNFKSVRTATNAKVRLVINYNTKHLKVSNDKQIRAMIFNQTEKEEKAYLMDIIALLAANIEQMDKAIEDKSKDVMEHKLYLWENLSELDRAEKSAVRQIVTQQVAASESLAEKKKRYRKIMAIPYFGRIDFQEKGQPEVLPLYIGIHSFFNPPTNENLIHDWRAPISSMFYDYELGEAHFDAPSGEVKGNIRLKRQYRIRDGKMEFMLESSLNIQDDILQKELSGNSDDRMKNIVATIQREQKYEEKKNAIIARLCNTPNPLLWQIAKVRRLTYDLQNIKTKTIAREYIDSLKQEFTAPFLVAETEQLFENAYPSEDAKSYQLPEGKATDIFRNIIKNHPGKVLFVDFWATSCGPCRSGIEATADLRKKYKDHPEFQFIYITGERESPAGAYKQYVEKHLKGEASYYVTGTEYNYLRQLFHFNGIPHYELVEKDGSISNEKLSSYSIGQYLKKRFGTSEPSETEQHAE